MPKVSIIVPVYKVEKTLEQCVSSVLNQSYTDFELILVDDGSPDNSAQICDYFERKDDRIQVIHQENGGVSNARNRGVEASCGTYIYFLDADDYIEDNTIESAVSVMEYKNLDLVIFGSTIDVYDNNRLLESKIDTSNKNMSFFDIKTDEWSTVFSGLNMAALWNKLYQSDIIKKNQLLFSADCVMYEDLKFNAEYCRYVANIESIDKPLYHYRVLKGENQIFKRKFKEPFKNSDSVTLSLLPYARELGKCSNNIFYAVAFQAYEHEVRALVFHNSFQCVRAQLKALVRNNSIYDEILNAQSHRKKVRIIKFLKRVKAYSILVWLYVR